MTLLPFIDEKLLEAHALPLIERLSDQDKSRNCFRDALLLFRGLAGASDSVYWRRSLLFRQYFPLEEPGNRLFKTPVEESESLLAQRGKSPMPRLFKNLTEEDAADLVEEAVAVLPPCFVEKRNAQRREALSRFLEKRVCVGGGEEEGGADLRARLSEALNAVFDSPLVGTPDEFCFPTKPLPLHSDSATPLLRLSPSLHRKLFSVGLRRLRCVGVDGWGC